MFNAIKYSQALEKAGFTREQAEMNVQFVMDVMNYNFATRADLKELEHRIEVRFQDVESRFQNVDRQFKQLESENKHRFELVDHRFEKLEQRLTIKLGSMMVVAIGVCATLVRFLSI